MITINDTLHTNADTAMLKAICPDTDSICFFDIETTGFSRNYNIVYLIGAVYFRNGISHYLQWLAESDSDDSRMNIQLTAPSGVVYSYFLEPDEQTVLPFSEGSGEYLITCYQQVDGNQYAALYTETLTIKLQNEFLPFLYPNQYVDFSSKSEACKLAASLVKEDMTDIDILKTFYTYVTSHISYDYDKADSVEAGYLPDVDDTLSTGTGICFDYAALTTAMLRSQDIPCKLQIGYSGDVKHAWIDVYIRGRGWVTKAVSFDGDTWKLMDPTFDANSDGDEAIQEYIGDESNYTVQFAR